MATLFFEDALLPEGWSAGVRLTVSGGRISAVETGVPPGAEDERHRLGLPAVANLHSHAFQRGMAGLAETRGPDHDSFWTWREVMYRFALAIGPDEMEAVAAQLYVEMLEAGFCRVGEFHYLHHDRDGRPYDDPAEMAGRILAAAAGTGIGLTLLPCFYAHGGFGGRPPTDGQRRFVNDPDGFALLVERCRRAAEALPQTVVGIAPHSLRAVTSEELATILPLAEGGPVHIHAAEQQREVEECLVQTGRRPVEWLLGEAGVDHSWCLVHATHMTGAEARRLAGSGAVAGLCPLTEASLGDGIFSGPAFLAAGGRFGIGSDSNVLVGIADELRQLETAQRLHHRERNVMTRAPGDSTGRVLFDAVVKGGARALGVSAGLAVGAPADILSLDLSHPALAGRSRDRVLDSWIFASRGEAVDCVWVAGRKLVHGGRHVRREPVAVAFRSAMSSLMAQVG
jgi:formimidoylglutamate deiminase